METGGTTPAGSGRTLRLDPFALPVQFPALDAGADGQIRQVELCRERVAVRRAVAGIGMVVRVPMAEFRGVMLRLVTDHHGPELNETDHIDINQDDKVTITLDHRDPALSVLLFTEEDSGNVITMWKAWGRVLGLPLLLAGRGEGMGSDISIRVDTVPTSIPAARRRRRSAMKFRRPSILMRRKSGRGVNDAQIHAEREIIARS